MEYKYVNVDVLTITLFRDIDISFYLHNCCYQFHYDGTIETLNGIVIDREIIL